MRRTAASAALRLAVTLVAWCNVVGLALMHSLGRHLDGHRHDRMRGVMMLAVRIAQVASRRPRGRPGPRAPSRRPALGFVLATTSVLRT